MYPQFPIVLASKSPRRQELLSLMGLKFTVELKEVDESYPEGLKPEEIAVYISEQKAKAFHAQDTIIITADTIVALDGVIYGKPTDEADAFRMLTELSGKKHSVYTGVTLAKNGQFYSFYDQTEVHFRAVEADEINYYIENFKPFDKAGSYGVQDWWGQVVVERLNGSYTNVMGLPTEKLFKALKRFI